MFNHLQLYTMKLIIAGTRTFDDYGLLCESIDRMNGVEEIISGGASGADSLGELYAKANELSIKRFPADWNKHGKSAGYIRNKEMAEYATHCIVFWDGISKGSKHMIDLAKEKGLTTTVILY